MKDNLWWKRTFERRLPNPLTEDIFQRKKHFWWMMSFDGRQNVMEVDLRWKMAFHGYQASIIDNGRRASMKDNISWNIIFKEIQTFALDFRMGRATNWFKVYLASAPTLFGPLLVTKHPLWLVHINVKQQKIVSHTIVGEGNNFILFPAFSSQRDQVLGINKVRNLHKVHLGIYVQ